MKRLQTFFFLFFIFSLSTSFAQSIITQNIYFDTDKYELDGTSILSLQSLQQELSAFNESSLKIIGHTDQDGSQDYNMDLSQRRAEEVKKHLLEIGFSTVDIELAFLGESDLINHASDDDAKQQNRRVTIMAKGYKYDNALDLVTQLESDNIDSRSIDQEFETTFNLRQGTEVKIPASAFCHMDGSPLKDGKVEMKFKEAFEYLDMVDERLFTQTEDQLLETGGMIYIEASQNGQPLRLQDGKSIELLFPEQEQNDGMQLFTGSEDDDGIIWDETGEEITSINSNSDLPFIEVDLSPLLDFAFEDLEIPSLDIAPMPAYPHPARISYPPYKENYTEEGYIEAVKKYDAVMAAHEEDKITRPQRLKEWLEEAERRKKMLFEHKKKYVISKVYDKLKSNVVRLEKDQGRISHDRLVDVLFAFLGKEVGKVPYDEWHYVKKTFGGTVVNVREEIGLVFPLYDQMSALRLFPEFESALKIVNGNILERKYELGYVDEEIFTRYVVSTSKLGWINCDRFYEVDESERTDLHFASTSDDDQFYLVFKNIRSLIRPSKSRGKVSFSGVPKGEDVRLIAVHFVDGDIKMARRDFTIGSDENVKLSFADAGIKDLKWALEAI